MRLTFVRSLVLSLLATAAPAVMADTVTYTYIGNNFNNFFGTSETDTGAGFITASVTFASPLPPNLPSETTTPISWMVSNQTTTYSSVNDPGFVFNLDYATNTSGDITAWDFEAQFQSGVIGGDLILVSTYDFLSVNLDASQIYCFGGATPCGQASISDDPGKWTETSGPIAPVPEPSTALLVFLGGLMRFFPKRWVNHPPISE
jgi:hypothetical protein